MAKMKRHYEELREFNEDKDLIDRYYGGVKKEYEERIKLLRLPIIKVVEALESEVQSIYDVIGDLQKGKVTADDIPKCYRDIVKDYLDMESELE